MALHYHGIRDDKPLKKVHRNYVERRGNGGCVLRKEFIEKNIARQHHRPHVPAEASKIKGVHFYNGAMFVKVTFCLLFFSGTLITLYKMQIYIDISRKIDIMKLW